VLGKAREGVREGCEATPVKGRSATGVEVEAVDGQAKAGWLGNGGGDERPGKGWFSPSS